LKSKVLVLKSDESSVYPSIHKIFDFFPHLLEKKAKKIAIKLNICAIKSPETGATSHPAVVEGLVRVLREKCAPETEINLVESNATYNRDVSHAYKLLGFEMLAKKYRVRCINLSRDSVVKKKIDGYVFREFNVPKTLIESDLFITLPKLKTHFITKITCGLKNQFGCLPNKDKSKFHEILDQAIVDANLFRKPDFVLVDGILGMGGPGSLCGLTKRYNLLVASDDVVATDCVCAKILGFNPYFVGHIRKAAAKRIGSMKYEVYGVAPKTMKVKTDFDKSAFYFERILGLAKRLSEVLHTGK
jgi:uncharacterized protein (DUF362 family)